MNKTNCRYTQPENSTADVSSNFLLLDFDTTTKGCKKLSSPPPVPQQRPIRQQEMPPAATAVPANAVQPPAPVVHQPPPPRRVNFNPIVNIQEIPNNNIGRRITRQMAQVEDHPNVQQGILEASRREQREARQRIDQFQRQENQNQQPIQNQQNDNDQSLIQERHTY